jgi:hypothetical protein
VETAVYLGISLIIGLLVWLIAGLAVIVYAYRYYRRYPYQCLSCGEFMRNVTLFDRSLILAVQVSGIPWMLILTPPPQKEMGQVGICRRPVY